MATGLAIMGFGGGAMIGTPLADVLMRRFATPDVGRRVADVRRHGRDLLRGDDGRRVRLSPAAAGLDAGRVDAADATSSQRRAAARACR